MKCSICRTQLEVGSRFRTEDVMYQTYESTRMYCPAHSAVFWGLDQTENCGSMYVDDWDEYRSYKFIDDLTSALGSFARQMEAEFEIKKEYRIKLLFNYKLLVSRRCRADEDGVPTKWYTTFRWIKNGAYHSFWFMKLWRGFKNQVTGILKHRNLTEWQARHYFDLDIMRNHNDWTYRLRRKTGNWLARRFGY